MARVSQRQLEVRKEEIIEAAARVFVRGGFQRTTMQEIAAEANVSTGTDGDIRARTVGVVQAINANF